MEDHIVRRASLKEVTGLSDSQRDRMEQAGDFPKRRQITERIVGWSFNEIQTWINHRLHGDDQGAR
jgi:prophage regulatory protein